MNLTICLQAYYIEYNFILDIWKHDKSAKQCETKNYKKIKLYSLFFSNDGQRQGFKLAIKMSLSFRLGAPNKKSPGITTEGSCFFIAGQAPTISE